MVRTWIVQLEVLGVLVGVEFGITRRVRTRTRPGGNEEER